MSDMKFGLAYTTALSTDQIEEWLEENCAGDWDVELADILTDQGKIKINIYFELEEDKNGFRADFAKRDTAAA